MGTLQGELIRQGIVRERDYVEELQLQNVHPTLRPLLRKMKEKRDKFQLLTESERVWMIPFQFGVTLDSRIEAAEHLCRALDNH